MLRCGILKRWQCRFAAAVKPLSLPGQRFRSQTFIPQVLFPEAGRNSNLRALGKDPGGIVLIVFIIPMFLISVPAVHRSILRINRLQNMEAR